MLSDLINTPGVVEHCELRDERVGFLALHGGLEAGTFEIAGEAAKRCGASLYAVVQPSDFQWHIPSHRYARSSSAALDAFCQHVDIAISLHGYGGVRDSPQRWTTVLLGGNNRGAAQHLAASINDALGDHYTIVDDIDAMPSAYRGQHCDNPVNQTRRSGVQIELPPRIRGNSPVWNDAPRNAHGFVEHTETLVVVLSECAISLR